MIYRTPWPCGMIGPTPSRCHSWYITCFKRLFCSTASISRGTIIPLCFFLFATRVPAKTRLSLTMDTFQLNKLIIKRAESFLSCWGTRTVTSSYCCKHCSSAVRYTEVYVPLGKIKSDPTFIYGINEFYSDIGLSVANNWHRSSIFNPINLCYFKFISRCLYLLRR